MTPAGINELLPSARRHKKVRGWTTRIDWWYTASQAADHQSYGNQGRLRGIRRLDDYGPQRNSSCNCQFSSPLVDYIPHRRRDSAVELSRVGGVNAPVGSRDPVYNFLCRWAIEVGAKWWHNDVILEISINIDHNSRSQTAMESVRSVLSNVSTESVGSRELVANCIHTADATQLDSWVASAVCIDDCSRRWTSARVPRKML